MPGLLQDLGKFLGAVENEVAHAMRAVGRVDGLARLHRVHEMDFCARQQAAHQRHFGERRTIEMRNAAGGKRAQHRRLRIAFDGVENVTGKARDERFGSAADRGGPHAMHRLGGAQGADEIVDGGQHIGCACAKLAHGVCPWQHHPGFAGGKSMASGLADRSGPSPGRVAPWVRA